MHTFTSRDLQELLAPREAPCVSIYLPLGPPSTDSRRNGLEIKNVLRRIEAALAFRAEWKPAAARVLESLSWLELANFVSSDGDTLAAFSSPGFQRCWHLPETMPAALIVSDSFHTQPLVKHLQNRLLYYVLALTQENVTLYQGTEHQLRVVQVPRMPRGMHELEVPVAEKSISKRMTTAIAGAGGGALFFGPGIGSDANRAKRDVEAFFRMVDKAVMPITHETNAPLIVATVDPDYGIFREISRNPALLGDRIEANPAAMTLNELRRRALDIVVPMRAAALARIADQYGAAAARHRGSDEIEGIAKAAAFGRVETLLVEDGRHLGGALDRKTGNVYQSMGSSDQAESDLLDDVSELVLTTGGDVCVLPPTTMPTRAGIAAIYRY
jgi:Bacterial archaeo-eukaryotic release factor family 3